MCILQRPWLQKRIGKDSWIRRVEAGAVGVLILCPYQVIL